MSVFSDATSEYNNYRYAHMCTVNALIKRRNELRDKEESERKIRDARFPTSIAQWRATDSPDIQLRVARFLVSDKDTKERMLSQYGWAWRQVEPLEGDFDQNVSSLFAAPGGDGDSGRPRRRLSALQCPRH